MARISDIDIPYVQMEEAAAPGTPGSGLVRVYAKTDGKLYIKDDAGTETDLTGEGGGGGGGTLLDAPITSAMLTYIHTAGVGEANQARWFRVLGSGTIDAIGIHIGNSTGNVCVAVYAASGTGRDARPGTRLGTSGSVSSPGTGYREISLGGSVAVTEGDFFYLAGSSADITFGCNNSSTAAVSALGLGYSMYATSSFPAPGDNPTITNGLNGWVAAMVGILA